MARAEISEEQKQDAMRLKTIWNARKDELSLTQTAVAVAIGVSQGTINGYLNANWPLNLHAATHFARFLRCRVSDFSTSLRNEIDYIAAFSTSAASVTSALLESINSENDERWPFPNIPYEKIRSLSVTERIRLEGAIEALLLHWESSRA